MQRVWRERAAKLHIPLSAKGQELSQSGSFTGVPLDTFRSVILMLQDKLLMAQETVLWLRGEDVTTPRAV